MRHLTVASPLGPILLTASDDGLTGLYLEAERRRPDPRSREDRHGLAAAAAQLAEYFAGSRTRFELALAPLGTPFQRAVWDELCAIPYGERITYTELARRVGRPTAIRAAGAANGRNPVSIVIPCHRVVGSAGALTGYSGGLAAKRFLLDLERAQISSP